MALLVVKVKAENRPTYFLLRKYHRVQIGMGKVWDIEGTLLAYLLRRGVFGRKAESMLS
jgi:hypothetical protein